jgi:hypothetical protein
MKTLIKIFGIIIILSMVFGCSTVRTLDPNYEAYKQAILSQKPLVLIEWSPDGLRMSKLEVNPAINIQQRQPDPPHPVWGTLNRVITVGGVIGGIWAYGQAQSDIIDSSQGATSISGSYNSPGGNMSGSDMNIPTTTTTNTETITGTDAMLPE